MEGFNQEGYQEENSIKLAYLPYLKKKKSRGMAAVNP